MASKTEPDQQETFKTQLDKAAVDQRERESESKPNPIVEKITEYIPAAAKVLAPEKEKSPESHIPGPPERPHHDDKIEAFVRDQHASKAPGGDLDQVAQ
ncbi:hypothetical protein VFPPC_13963 [Pochonia chlamydosporia 170]|uniref:Uncharacterized protein n=1 Tax=Pochonia chlamydosporia 170 TaxID=1380566 RepID=A0A179FIP3_METCM|nr:hypothetical protein VFPPC_13963 [Pochonia chlamydosporia 170]OAQ64883.1 hypothetical protein VFPPC_13963 [Pochonia chlamydosporia 170]